ncbi:MAG: 2-dehydropantoate 2-reductase [Methanomassiliicoccales archaeon]|nr:MAG: 2-dehydropantoate 2-reductase [Methanomassiliicoccales archaeon]
MRILIFGAGAMGTFLAGCLSQKHDVTLYGRGKKLKAIKENGIRINGITELTAKLNTADDLKVFESELFDLIVLSVKSYDTPQALQTIMDMKGQAPLLSLQNGLDNEEKIAKAVGVKRTLGGVTSHGLTYISPGQVHHAGVGETIIGELDGSKTDRISEIAGALSSVGIKTSISKNIKTEIWVKGVVNSGINPLTALTGLKNGFLLKIPSLTRLLENTCLEGVTVAQRAGVDLQGMDVIKKTKNVAKLTAENKSSMLQDIQSKRRTEIDSINGAIVESGKKYDVDTPINSTLVALIKGIEEGGNR